MREVKFRGKRLDGEFVYGYLVQTKDSTFICYAGQYDDDLFLSPNNILIEVDPKTVGEFTGLRDSKFTEEYPKGQEIYEGDIAKLYQGTIAVIKHGGHQDNDVIESTEHLPEFFYLDCDREERFTFGFYAQCLMGECFGLDNRTDKWITVIGNIYENPELLEVK